MQRLPLIQVMVADNAQGTWKSTQDSLLSPVERGIFPLTISFVEMRNNISTATKALEVPKRWNTTRYAVHNGN